MQKIITIERTDLSALYYDNVKIAHKGQVPEIRNQESLMLVLKALTE